MVMLPRVCWMCIQAIVLQKLSPVKLHISDIVLKACSTAGATLKSGLGTKITQIKEKSRYYFILMVIEISPKRHQPSRVASTVIVLLPEKSYPILNPKQK